LLVSHDALHRSYPRASRQAKIGSVTVIQIGRKVL